PTSRTFYHPNVSVQHAASEGFEPDWAVRCLRALEAVRRWTVYFQLVHGLVPVQLHRNHRFRRPLAIDIESRRLKLDVEGLPLKRRKTRVWHLAWIGENASANTRCTLLLRRWKHRSLVLVVKQLGPVRTRGPR